MTSHRVTRMKIKEANASKPKLSKNKKAVDGKTKRELLAKIQSERSRLEETLAPLSDAQLIEPGVVGDWSIKDILAHLSVWEGRLRQRVKGQAERGTDLGTPEFNAQVFVENRNRDLKDVRAEFQRSYVRVIVLAEGLSNMEVERWW